MKPASLLSRTLALFVDLGLWGGIAAFLVLPAGLETARVGSDLLQSLQQSGAADPYGALWFFALAMLFLVLTLILCILFDAYCYRFERRYGATLGKAVLGICVKDAATGALPSRQQCLWREVTRIFEVGAIVPAVLFVVFDPRSRRLGDRIAGTEVVEGVSDLGQSSFPLTGLPADEFRSRPAKGPAEFGRRALAFLADFSVVMALLSPFDLVETLWRWAPELGRVLTSGAIDSPLAMPGTGYVYWATIPFYFAYEHYCRMHFGETVGRKIFGLRRNGTPGIRFALVPFLLFPLTFVEGAVRLVVRKPAAALADRLAGSRYVDVR